MLLSDSYRCLTACFRSQRQYCSRGGLLRSDSRHRDGDPNALWARLRPASRSIWPSVGVDLGGGVSGRGGGGVSAEVSGEVRLVAEADGDRHFGRRDAGEE